VARLIYVKHPARAALDGIKAVNVVLVRVLGNKVRHKPSGFRAAEDSCVSFNNVYRH
jgi:hypothetical protein